MLVKNMVCNADVEHNGRVLHLVRVLFMLNIVSMKAGSILASAIDRSRPAGMLVDWDKFTIVPWDDLTSMLSGKISDVDSEL